MEQSCIMVKGGRGLDALFAFRLLTAFLLCGVTCVSALANTPVDDFFLQCDSEVRTRQLAFQLGEQEIEEFTPGQTPSADRDQKRPARPHHGPHFGRCAVHTKAVQTV